MSSRRAQHGIDPDSLFERFSWMYAFFREHVFRDDSLRISRFLWKSEESCVGSRLVELGCGPGFYSRRLAAACPQLKVTGIDRSLTQLKSARLRAEAEHLRNCSFQQADVRDLPFEDGSVDALISARLFTVVFGRQRTLSEMYRVLSPGGRAFIAEPRSALRAAIPLRTMWMLAGLYSFFLPGATTSSAYREPARVSVMRNGEFEHLISSCPWRVRYLWHDLWYQYAVCEKPSAPAMP